MSILRNLCILTSKYTITPATKGFINAAIAISVSPNIQHLGTREKPQS